MTGKEVIGLVVAILIVILMATVLVSYVSALSENQEKYGILTKGNYTNVIFMEENATTTKNQNITFRGTVKSVSDKQITMSVEGRNFTATVHYNDSKKVNVGDEITILGTPNVENFSLSSTSKGALDITARYVFKKYTFPYFEAFFN